MPRIRARGSLRSATPGLASCVESHDARLAFGNVAILAANHRMTRDLDKCGMSASRFYVYAALTSLAIEAPLVTIAIATEDVSIELVLPALLLAVGSLVALFLACVSFIWERCRR